MGKSIFQTAGMISPQFPANGMQGLNPLQQAYLIMQSIRDPAIFAKQQFPDIPDNIIHDPNAVLKYIQQTRGITDEQLQMFMKGGMR